MKFLACIMLGTAFAMRCAAQTPGGLADLAIIDRDTGAALRPHYYRGEYWIAGTPGARYAIEIRNHLGERLLAVMSVDGVNVLSGADAAWDQGGYVFDAGESYQIAGWRKSDAEIADFTFTAAPNSYAGRTGRDANVGVIGVALFRERAPVAPGPAAASRAAPPQASLAEIGPLPLAAPKLGTGHGDREYSYVNHTTFIRLQPQPNEVIRIRYDSWDNLLAMGIVQRPRPKPPILNPFPGSQPQYVPDPPG